MAVQLQVLQAAQARELRNFCRQAHTLKLQASELQVGLQEGRFGREIWGGGAAGVGARRMRQTTCAPSCCLLPHLISPTCVSVKTAGSSWEGSTPQLQARLCSCVRLVRVAATVAGSSCVVSRRVARRGKRCARLGTASEKGLSSSASSERRLGDRMSSMRSGVQSFGSSSQERAVLVKRPSSAVATRISRAEKEASRGPTRATCARRARTQARRSRGFSHRSSCAAEGAGGEEEGIRSGARAARLSAQNDAHPPRPIVPSQRHPRAGESTGRRSRRKRGRSESACRSVPAAACGVKGGQGDAIGSSRRRSNAAQRRQQQRRTRCRAPPAPGCCPAARWAAHPGWRVRREPPWRDAGWTAAERRAAVESGERRPSGGVDVQPGAAGRRSLAAGSDAGRVLGGLGGSARARESGAKLGAGTLGALGVPGRPAVSARDPQLRTGLRTQAESAQSALAGTAARRRPLCCVALLVSSARLCLPSCCHSIPHHCCCYSRTTALVSSKALSAHRPLTERPLTLQRTQPPARLTRTQVPPQHGGSRALH